MLSRFPWFTRYPDRKLEWLLAFYTAFFGMVLCLPPDSMAVRSFYSALGILPEWLWGVIYALVGLLHALALHVNGRAAWTPFARLGALFLNSQVFLALALSLVGANPWGTGVITYGFIAVGFCGAAMVSAAQDCGREVKVWKARHAGA